MHTLVVHRLQPSLEIGVEPRRIRNFPLLYVQFCFRTKGALHIAKPFFNLAAPLRQIFGRVNHSEFQPSGNFRQVRRLKDRPIVAVKFFLSSVFGNRSLPRFFERRQILAKEVRSLADLSRFVAKYGKQAGDAHLPVHLRVRDA